MHTLDTLIVLVYAVGITAFGAWFSKRSASVLEFTAAGRRLPGWLLGLSVFATFLSSISFLALPGKAYADNWSAFVFSLSLPIAAFAAARWFVPLYRQSADISAYAYLERRFGLWARLYAASFYLLTQLARVGTILFLVALALSQLTGWDLTLVIVVTGILVTFYTAAGGIEAVIWTDAVQAVILVIGAIACVFLLLSGFPDGPAQLFSIAGQADKFSLGSLDIDFRSPTLWVVLFYGIVINLQNFGIDQSYIQRYISARSLSAARRSVWIGTLIYIPVSALFLFIGTALFAHYLAQPDLLPTTLQGRDAADRIFPHYIVTGLPPGATGLIIAALFAAAMSSIDTSLNSSATVLLSDVYRRLLRQDLSDKASVKFLRAASIVLGVFGTGVALLMISIKSALDAWWNLAGIFSGGMLGLFLLGIISRRANSATAGIAVVVGLLVLAWAALSADLGLPFANPLHALLTTVIGTLTILTVGVLVSQKQMKRSARVSPALTLYDLVDGSDGKRADK